MRIALISCTKVKKDYPCTAKEMYSQSTLFKKAVGYIDSRNYDETLNSMRVKERRIDAEVEINPAEDLVPLCANCHRMAHRDKNNVLSVDKLKSMINLN